MTGITGGGVLGIGDLSRRTGVPVRTIRFYCDEGLLDAGRSAGGHRRFDEAAVERLRTVRRLRAIGLGLPAVADVLAGRRSLTEVIAGERAGLDAAMAEMAWRRAALRAVADAAPADRTDRLDLLAAVPDVPAARDSLIAFWRRDYLDPATTPTAEMFLSVIAPPPPVDPTPDQVVAYAGMVVVASDASLGRRMRARDRVRDESALHEGIGLACDLARPLVAAGRPPGAGEALDVFVAAHAAVRGARDTPAFRRELRARTEVERDPRLRRYWRLVGAVTGERVTLGDAYSWLLDALPTA
ncbi:MerR family transcriptional regulator [Saccharothrix xinjiangensis]|uniref:MerR family transcriptional regulator n=1 Tax=Saccharothrix xinjiangensis TaxID=204798 RepID=A0ABV9XTU7_9PSEU